MKFVDWVGFAIMAFMLFLSYEGDVTVQQAVTLCTGAMMIYLLMPFKKK